MIGTLDNPLTVAGAVKYVKSLGSDVQSSSGVYVKGKISRIDEGGSFGASGTYGNATFYISDDGGTTSEQFYCYRILYLGNKKWSSQTDKEIAVGDDVIIFGNVVNYKGTTPETVQGTAFVYDHNGENRGQGEGGGGGTEGDPSGTGTLEDPFNVAAARAAVKDLTWTSNENYEKTGTVYVKGKISRIAENGTFAQSGIFGNATFYINDDGGEGAELYAYRILYLGNKKYTSGTDIKVGDDVFVSGELMNYKGNTPETVANESWLYSLNGKTDGGSGGGGGDTPAGSSVTIETNDALSWAAETDGTYGGGFSTMTQGLKLGYYKHTGGNAPVAPNANHVRIYKNGVLSVASTDGKKIKKIVIGCAPNAGNTSYCFDMTGLEGGASATCDKTALTVTWTGSASKVVLHANNGQVRMEKITVEFE